MIIGDGGKCRFRETDDTERCAELAFGQSLIVEQQGQGRAGNRGNRIKDAEPRAERESDGALRPQRAAITGGLNQNQRQQDQICAELEPGLTDARNDKGSKDHTGN